MANDGGNGDGHIATVAVRSPSHHREIKEAEDSSDNVDSISSLPDVILQHILSFIPTRFAIRTSVLSKRWKHVWSDTPSLYIDLCNKPKALNADSINKTLTRYTSRKMMKFHLCINENMPYIEGLIRFVMSRNVEIMSLYLLFRRDDNYNIPDFFYINSSVKQLTVAYFYDMKIPSCSVSWTSLKKLSLLYCHLSCECIDRILSGCPILESLTLGHCNKLMMRVLDLSKSLRLRTLEIDHCIWVVSEPIQIVAPHIHYLRLTNSQPPCTLVDVSSLTEARLDPWLSLSVEPKQSMVLKMLEKLHSVEKLTFGANLLKILSLAELRSVPFPSFKVKDLRLETMVVEDVIHGLVRLLQNSPELKKLTVHGTIPEEYIDKLLGFARLEIRSVSKGL